MGFNQRPMSFHNEVKIQTHVSSVLLHHLCLLITLGSWTQETFDQIPTGTWELIGEVAVLKALSNPHLENQISTAVSRMQHEAYSKGLKVGGEKTGST